MAAAGIEAVRIMVDDLFFAGRAIAPKCALARRLPICAFSRETFEPGALMFYGPDILTYHHPPHRSLFRHDFET
jgi:hypothetical protein